MRIRSFARPASENSRACRCCNGAGLPRSSARANAWSVCWRPGSSFIFSARVCSRCQAPSTKARFGNPTGWTKNETRRPPTGQKRDRIDRGSRSPAARLALGSPRRLLRRLAAVRPLPSLLLGRYESQSVGLSTPGGRSLGAGRIVCLDEILPQRLRTSPARTGGWRASAGSGLPSLSTHSHRSGRAATQRAIPAAGGVGAHSAFCLGLCLLPESHRPGGRRRGSPSRPHQKGATTSVVLSQTKPLPVGHSVRVQCFCLPELEYALSVSASPGENPLRCGIDFQPERRLQSAQYHLLCRHARPVLPVCGSDLENRLCP